MDVEISETRCLVLSEESQGRFVRVPLLEWSMDTYVYIEVPGEYMDGYLDRIHGHETPTVIN